MPICMCFFFRVALKHLNKWTWTVERSSWVAFTSISIRRGSHLVQGTALRRMRVSKDSIVLNIYSILIPLLFYPWFKISRSFPTVRVLFHLWLFEISLSSLKLTDRYPSQLILGPESGLFLGANAATCILGRPQTAPKTLKTRRCNVFCKSCALGSHRLNNLPFNRRSENTLLSLQLLQPDFLSLL